VSQTYTAVIKQSGAWWIGWIEEVPGVNCQEPTREKLLETLKITLQEALDLNRREAREAAGDVGCARKRGRRSRPSGEDQGVLPRRDRIMLEY
jgi:predicted RNase H-like HicB family nuclease